MPKLSPKAPKKAKAARVRSELHKFKVGKMHSGSKTGPKVTSRKQAIAIALSESGQSKKRDSDDGKMLERYKHHEQMAEKHRAHANLIEAKMRVKGKRIQRDYDTGSHKIVEEHE